ncbi:aerobactin siderophore biosynthesis protein iucB [Aulographum hederae CBS 113979]|uniref:Aerobactin siderophore biosynthesis protein iucB n=1 Tax=Aulographum hederae CBS 113979 TaxID=1176131 RepID=A0A6G1GTQ2_9PEZI|nr:aerobactin siderophore biosynthesis protein iucB [Aulographum hederae CBS 113979]
MAPSTVHLPNGQNLTVTPVFGGLYFKSNVLNTSHSPFPPGWTIIINSEDEEDKDKELWQVLSPGSEPTKIPAKHTVHRYKKPTLRNDHMYIASISNPNSNDYKPPTSPTRQIAMMLWATLWWYFHQPKPDTRITSTASEKTTDAGKPKGEWRININREGIFKGRVVLPKLERMGLITTEDSTVGTDTDERSGEGWREMFVSQRTFWQLDARIYLFTLTPANNASIMGDTPLSSRPSSPSGQGELRPHSSNEVHENGLRLPPDSITTPFHSSSHLPTYYPPPPPQWIFTNNIRHPIRPKPMRQGETFYTRYVPSVGQYLSFRVASLSHKPSMHYGPSSGTTTHSLSAIANPLRPNALSDSLVPTVSSSSPPVTTCPCDSDLLHKWMNNDRVAHFWGEAGPASHQEAFLTNNLKSRHSFPVIGCWDGVPFGYFEIYWVKEDVLGKYMGGECGDWDRGIHCLVGEQDFRGAHRVRIWLSALVHYCWLADSRTEVVHMEPRVDNEKLLKYCQDVGFYKEREIAFPHKQSNLLKIKRDSWQSPAL